jgi:hypothetical protein
MASAPQRPERLLLDPRDMAAALLWAVRVALTFTTAFLSKTGGLEPWAIGALFGLAVLAWGFLPDLRPQTIVRGAAFVAAAAIVNEIVFQIAVWGSFHLPQWDARVPIAPVPAAVLTGTVLLPLAHRLLLGTTWRRLAVAVPGIGLTCAACIVFASRVIHLNMGTLAVVWQWAYLMFLLGATAPADEPRDEPAPALSAASGAGPGPVLPVR